MIVCAVLLAALATVTDNILSEDLNGRDVVVEGRAIEFTDRGFAIMVGELPVTVNTDRRPPFLWACSVTHPKLRVSGCLEHVYERAADGSRGALVGIRLDLADGDSLVFLPDALFLFNPFTLTFLLLCFGAYLVRLSRRQLRSRTILAERKRMADDLHDTIEQHLVGVGMLLQLGRYDQAREILLQAKREMRDVVWGLKNDDMMRLSPAEMVRRYAHEETAKGVCRVETGCLDLPERLDAAQMRDLSLILREAVGNAVKHGRARKVAVVCDALSAGGWLLRISNDGAPFDPAKAPGAAEGHFGLEGMKARARRLGAELTIAAEHGRTVVSVRRQAADGSLARGGCAAALAVAAALVGAASLTAGARQVRLTGLPFAMPEIAVPEFAERDFPIDAYGARPAESCTEAIAAAMAACERAGGGRVVVPKGTWLTGAVRFRGNCELHLAEGATLEFTDDPADYLPAVPTSWEGVECLNYSPLIYAYGVTNVAITGRGLIRPRMTRWREWFARPPAHRRAMERLYHWGSTNAVLAARDVTKLADSNVRPHLIQFNRCANVLLDGFRIRESPFWMIHLFHSENCVVRNLDTYAHGHNNDGVDIEMTRNVLVENCTFDQGDDGIVLKAGRNQDAWRLNRPTENVVVTNCTFRFAHALVAIGSELSGGIRNVYLSDCRIDGALNLLYVKTNRRRGGFVENVYVRNVDTRDVRRAVFGLETDVLYQWAGFPDYELRYTRIANVNVRNVHAAHADWLIDVAADEHLPADGLHFEDMSLDSARVGVSRIVNAKNVTLDRVRVGDLPAVKWVSPWAAKARPSAP